jgi:hypothetical protein
MHISYISHKEAYLKRRRRAGVDMNVRLSQSYTSDLLTEITSPIFTNQML